MAKVDVSKEKLAILTFAKKLIPDAYHTAIDPKGIAAFALRAMAEERDCGCKKCTTRNCTDKRRAAALRRAARRLGT